MAFSSTMMSNLVSAAVIKFNSPRQSQVATHAEDQEGLLK